jgi:hypothetical protein
LSNSGDSSDTHSGSRALTCAHLQPLLPLLLLPLLLTHLQMHMDRSRVLSRLAAVNTAMHFK